MYSNEIVHIPAVTAISSKPANHFLIEVGEQEVCKQLAWEVAYWQTFALSTCEQRFVLR